MPPRTRSNPATSPHYHGHVSSHWPAPNPTEDDGSFVRTLHGPQEVAAWMAEQLREATGKPEIRLDDELSTWAHMAQQGQTISTGLQGGPTITALAVNEDDCRCSRPELRPIAGRHGL